MNDVFVENTENQQRYSIIELAKFAVYLTTNSTNYLKNGGKG